MLTSTAIAAAVVAAAATPKPFCSPTAPSAHAGGAVFCYNTPFFTIQSFVCFRTTQQYNQHHRPETRYDHYPLTLQYQPTPRPTRRSAWGVFHPRI